MPKGDGNRGKSKGLTWLKAHVGHAGEGCLIWPFGCDDKGYGTLWYFGKVSKASRVMCILAHGTPPSSRHHAAHSCGRGHDACTHPQHLSWKTPLQNRLESNEHGTGNQPAPRRLTVDKVDAIRASSKSYVDLGAEYGVHPDTIGKIFRGETWVKPRSQFTQEQIRKIKEMDSLGARTVDIAKAVGADYIKVYKMQLTQNFRGE
jgi:hypothetical protein